MEVYEILNHDDRVRVPVANQRKGCSSFGGDVNDEASSPDQGGERSEADVM